MGLIGKVKEVIRRQPFLQSKESWSFHRFFVFFFSKKGQKRLFKFIGKVIRFLWREVFGGRNDVESRYSKWRKKNTPNKNELKRLKQQANSFKYSPLISIILPTYKPKIDFLKEAIDSVKSQVYSNWELCISDDQSNDADLADYLNELAKDPKIKLVFRKTNGHISANSNSAVELASGEFISLLDHDDLLAPEALFYFVKQLNKDANIDFMYSDEDKINDKGWFMEPHFKPNWSPDNLLSRNYICHLVLIRKTIMDKVGGFRVGLEGSQDYDLVLRITETLQRDKIVHIPKVLYHWRMHEDSTASNAGAKEYAFENGIKALDEAFERRGIKAKAKLQEGKPGFYHIDYELVSEPKISIIIPTKNNAEVLSVCLESVFNLSEYKDFEVIVLDNNSDEESLFKLLDDWKTKEPHRFKSVALSYAFNFAKLMNDGLEQSDGDYIVLLNNDTEVLQKDWLHNMLRHAQRESTGAVGVKLYYHNDTIQHAGVVIGMGGVAGHAFVAKEKDDLGYFCYLTSATNYSAVTAACLMVSRKKYLEIGGFDETLAVEFNDVDFCLKLIEAGYYNLYIPEVELYHYGSLTRGHPHANRESCQRSLKEIKYFKSKWQSYIDDDPFYNPNLSRLRAHFDLKM